MLSAKEKKIFKLRKKRHESLLACENLCNADFVILLDGVVECADCGEIKGKLAALSELDE